jgi:hypothetical protein
MAKHHIQFLRVVKNPETGEAQGHEVLGSHGQHKLDNRLNLASMRKEAERLIDVSQGANGANKGQRQFDGYMIMRLTHENDVYRNPFAITLPKYIP